MSNARNLANLLSGDTTVTSADIADGTVATVDIVDGAITTAKIGDGQITQAKFASGLNLGAGLFKGENGTTGDTTNGAGDIFRVNEQTLNTNTTITSAENVSATGPLTIADGVTLTVNSGGTVAIV